ncbi:MAG: type 4a pilus biogenesis protein PilO [Desulfobulbaceae bacterium]|nr:type 4a pilus biogenesis protein PilO [Desulfobulbaceae bacterium]
MQDQLKKSKQAYAAFIDNKLVGLDQKHKAGIFAASMLVPMVLFFFLFLSPKNDEITKLRKDNIALKKQVQIGIETFKKLDEHKAEKAYVELQLKAASLLLPKQKEIPKLLTDISEHGTSSGLEFVSFTPKPERKEKFYAVIPISIKVNGSYHNIGTFLDRISKLNRIVSANNLKLGGGKLVDNDIRLTASLELVTYRFLSIAESKQSKKKRR